MKTLGNVFFGAWLLLTVSIPVVLCTWPRDRFMQRRHGWWIAWFAFLFATMAITLYARKWA